MIKVSTGAAEAGLLDRHGTRGSSFVYLPDLARARRFRDHAGAPPLLGRAVRTSSDIGDESARRCAPRKAAPRIRQGYEYV